MNLSTSLKTFRLLERKISAQTLLGELDILVKSLKLLDENLKYPLGIKELREKEIKCGRWDINESILSWVSESINSTREPNRNHIFFILIAALVLEDVI